MNESYVFGVLQRKRIFPESRIIGLNIDILKIFYSALSEDDPVKFIGTTLDKKSEDYVQCVYNLYGLAISKLRELATINIDKDNILLPNIYQNITEIELKNIYHKSLKIYEYFDAFIRDILRDNFYHKPGLLDENSNFITKIEYPELFHPYAYIHQGVFVWTSKLVHFARIVYYLNRKRQSEHRMSNDYFKNKLFELNKIQFSDGNLTSLTRELVRLDIDFINDSEEQLKKSFSQNFKHFNNAVDTFNSRLKLPEMV